MKQYLRIEQKIIALGIIVILIACSVWTIIAQTSGCSTTSADKWASGSTVYYNLSGFDATQRQQIINAINQWNNSGAGVTFSPSDANHPSAYTIQAGTTDGGQNTFAYTSWTTVSNTDRTVTSATTTFYLNETFTSGNAVYDQAVEGYDTIFLKVALHEIGHPMGLNHPTQPQGESICAQTDGATIMNGYCGTNDRQNNAPATMPQCDKDNLNPNECPCGDCVNGCCGANAQRLDGVEGCGGEECPCGDCVNGCSTCDCGDCVNGCEENCGWETIPGQCYGGVAYGDCWDYYGAFDPGNGGCQYEPPYCDPDQTIWVCN